MLLLNLVKCRTTICYLSLSHKSISKNEVFENLVHRYIHLCHIYCSLKDLAHLLAIHYDRHCIGELSFFHTNQRNYVHFELFQCMKKRTKSDELIIF